MFIEVKSLYAKWLEALAVKWIYRSKKNECRGVEVMEMKITPKNCTLKTAPVVTLNKLSR